MTCKNSSNQHQERNLKRAIDFLPFAFMLHNIEEAISMEDWIRKSPLSISYCVTTKQFVIAVTLFTALGFMAVFVKSLYKNEERFLLLITGFSGMLLLNVFFPHLITAVALKMYVPGVITALLIILPLTIYILWHIYKTSKLSMKTMVFTIIGGGVFGIVLAYLFLSIGKLN